MESRNSSSIEKKTKEAVLQQRIKVKIGGVWKDAVAKIKVGGTWK